MLALKMQQDDKITGQPRKLRVGDAILPSKSVNKSNHELAVESATILARQFPLVPKNQHTAEQVNFVADHEERAWIIGTGASVDIVSENPLYQAEVIRVETLTLSKDVSGALGIATTNSRVWINESHQFLFQPCVLPHSPAAMSRGRRVLIDVFFISL